jgi:hypothetical protein
MRNVSCSSSKTAPSQGFSSTYRHPIAGKDASISNADKVATLAVSDSKIGGKTSSTFNRLAHFLRIFTVHCDGRDTIHADGDARRSQTEPRRLDVSAYYTAQARVNYNALSMNHVRFRNALLRDLAPFAFARRVTSVGNDPYCGACTRSAREYSAGGLYVHRVNACPRVCAGSKRARQLHALGTRDAKLSYHGSLVVYRFVARSERNSPRLERR